MKSFYIDTNIFIDLLLRRDIYFENASELFSLATENKVKFSTSSHCIATVHYVVKKNYEEQNLRQILNDFLDFIDVISVDAEILRKALKSNHKDFEDAIQIFCAHQIKNLDAIITRNIKDFSTAEVPVFSPDEAINYINKKLN